MVVWFVGCGVLGVRINNMYIGKDVVRGCKGYIS